MPRPKSFDPDEKLREAMDVFWRAGFEGTSIPMLEEELAINRFSIYDTFGKKRELFLSALDLYAGDLARELVHPLAGGTAGLADLRRFLRAWGRVFLGEGARGCLMCNAATEMGAADAEIGERIRAYFDGLEAALLECLERARRLGELEGDASSTAHRAAAIRLAIQGALVNLAMIPEKDEAARIEETLRVVALAPLA